MRRYGLDSRGSILNLRFAAWSLVLEVDQMLVALQSRVKGRKSRAHSTAGGKILVLVPHVHRH